jgi:cell wall-associated NlpC family hydrolase
MDLIEVARSWLNTPWQHNQKTKGIGVDCVNFLNAIANESGVIIEEIPEHYGRVATDNNIEEYLERNFKKKPTKDIEKNNIILYAFSGYKNHVALATSNNTIIHANSRVGKVVEHNIDGVWLRCINSVWVIK